MEYNLCSFDRGVATQKQQVQSIILLLGRLSRLLAPAISPQLSQATVKEY